MGKILLAKKHFMKKNLKPSKTGLMPDEQSSHFTGKENHFISLAEASELTRAFRENHPLQTKAEFFGKEAILAILSQPGCVGIRIYYGQEPGNGKKHLVIVGAEQNQNDMYTGYIAERGKPCPSYCGIKNLLNS